MMPHLHRLVLCCSSVVGLWACSVFASPASPAVDSATGGPFACGELDFYELDALYAGGAIEGRCSDVPVGTWRTVAAYLREHVPCPKLDERVAADPQLACDLAECGNLLLKAAARTSCSDFSGAWEDGESDACFNAYQIARTINCE